MSGGYGSQLKKFYKYRLFYKILTLIYPPMPTLNTIPKKDIIEIQQKIFGKNRTILNFGHGASSGSGKVLWKSNLLSKSKIINTDILFNENVTLVSDAHKLPFKNESFDSIISQAV